MTTNGTIEQATAPVVVSEEPPAIVNDEDLERIRACPRELLRDAVNLAIARHALALARYYNDREHAACIRVLDSAHTKVMRVLGAAQ